MITSSHNEASASYLTQELHASIINAFKVKIKILKLKYFFLPQFYGLEVTIEGKLATNPKNIFATYDL